MDEATWLALTAVLTALGGTWTFFAWRNRGAAAGLRGAAITLLFPALFLTDTLEMLVEIGSSVADWATGLVFSPVVWTGIALFGVSVVLFGASRFLDSRTPGSGSAPQTPAAPAGKQGAALPPTRPAAPAIDDDLADIEELLRRRGIE